MARDLSEIVKSLIKKQHVPKLMKQVFIEAVSKEEDFSRNNGTKKAVADGIELAIVEAIPDDASDDLISKVHGK